LAFNYEGDLLMDIQKLEQLHEGKAKKVFKTNNPDLYWIEYKEMPLLLMARKKALS
jgi:phosphoribosylaminoimidazole-succinocarboxamide synthase